jgi:hypothetical protein
MFYLSVVGEHFIIFLSLPNTKYSRHYFFCGLESDLVPFHRVEGYVVLSMAVCVQPLYALEINLDLPRTSLDVVSVLRMHQISFSCG